MEDFEKIYVGGVFVIAVNLIRATINEAIAFRKIVEEEINSGQTQLVIDLSNCDYIDSTFFGAIIVASKRLIDIGYKLKVVKPTMVGEPIVSHTNYLKVFDNYTAREAAIKSFDEDNQLDS